MRDKNNKTVSLAFVLTVLFIYPLPQIAIDIYLPSWPSLLIIFHTNQALLQSSLTIYILFLGLAQLFYGSCSDKFGRKPTLLFGCSFFALSSIASMFVTSIWQLLLIRALQGLGMGCGFAVASAILADVFTGKNLARMTAYSTMIYSLAVIFAPVFGSYLQYYIGWQAAFGAMALYGILLVAFLYIFVYETNLHPNPHALLPKTLAKNYLSLLSNRRFIGNVTCMTTAYCIMVAFGIISPFLLQIVLHVSVVSYGKLMALVGLSYFIGTSINSHLLKSQSIDFLMITGFILIFASSVFLAVAGLIGWFTPNSVILFTCITISGTGFIFPNGFSSALEIFPEKGLSSALMGSSGLIGTSLISLIIMHMHVNNELGLSAVYSALAVLSCLAYVLSRPTNTDNTPA